MLGSSQSVSDANMVINTAVAESLRKYADQLDASRGTTERVQIIAELLGVSEALVFQEFSKQF